MGWEDFNKNCQFVVRLGNRVRFWQDGWYGDHPFQLAFPRLYGIAFDKEVLSGCVRNIQMGSLISS